MQITTREAVATDDGFSLEPDGGKPLRRPLEPRSIGYGFRLLDGGWEVGCGSLLTRLAGVDGEGRRVFAEVIQRTLVLKSSAQGATLDVPDGAELTMAVATDCGRDRADVLRGAIQGALEIVDQDVSHAEDSGPADDAADEADVPDGAEDEDNE
jgi:hypothetical protein